MRKMVMARGALEYPKPWVYVVEVPVGVFQKFSSDRAWTGFSFGQRTLSVIVPGEDLIQARDEWDTLKTMLAKSPLLFDAMRPKKYVPQ